MTPRLAAHLLAYAALAAGCAPGAAQPAAAAPLPYLELHVAGASAEATLPLVVALHGRGDRAEWFARVFDDFPVPARVLVLRPPHPWSGGQAWYLEGRARATERAAIARHLVSLAARVAATAEAVARARPTRGRPLVMGFSQGAMLAYTLAATQPDAFAAAFPVSGFFFRETDRRALAGAGRAPPIFAWHGRRDGLVPLRDECAGAARLRELGARVELREHDGAHTFPDAVRREVFAEMARVLAQAPAAPR